MRNLIESTLDAIDWVLAREDKSAAASFQQGDTRHDRTAWILTYTGCSDEPRVIRQAWSLSRNGWNVVVAGYDGHSPRPPEWSFVRLPNRGRASGIAFRAAMFAQRRLGKILYIRAASLPAPAQFGARLYYFGLPNWRQNYRELLRIADAIPHLRANLVIAHDFYTCPAGAALARKWGAPLVVDCHEYARGQYMDDPAWVRDGRLFATAMQDDYLSRADAVTTVCDGIGDLLNKEQRLKRPALTIRSLPLPERQPFRVTGDRISVLYHGILSADRALDRAVESIRSWRPEFHLVLRGDGDPEIVRDLRRVAEENGVSDRLTIEPPVDFANIVSAANGADIGYFVQQDYSLQKRFALPNKFFEYVMAGLALCVSDLPEMAKLVTRYHCGRLVADADPRAIAEAINSLTREEIDRMKRASLAAAAELNWAAEERKLLDLFAEILRKP